MKNPKVSIIIPVYNGSNYLKEAINSALAQTYKNCEIIVVNDGSNDKGETERIALSYKNKIRYFVKENGGVASALNLGISKMQGDYFAWLSHDDIYYPEKIELQISEVIKNNNKRAIVYSGNDFLINNKEVVKCNNLQNYDINQIINGIFPVIFGVINTVTVLIHKSHFERVGLFDESLVTTQDYDMWFRMFSNQKLIYIEKSLIRYRIHDEQGTLTIPKVEVERKNLYNNMLKKITKKEIEEVFGGKYKFYYDMTNIFKQFKWEDHYKYAKEKFLEQVEPDNLNQLNEELKKLLEINKYNSLCLFCSGKNAMVLYEELRLRNINVHSFSDNDPDKWGKSYYGIECINPNQIDKNNTLIIITKDNPEELKIEFLNMGFKKVITYDELRKKIFMVTPKKDKVIEVVNISI